MRVLVADDDFGSRLVTQATVQALGHPCLTAADGAEAWAVFCAERPDVIITDLSMPEMDGLELCRRIRETQQGYTYVVLLTAHAEPHEVLDGMRAGADDYLSKPLNPQHLEARLLAAGRVTALHAELARSRAELTKQTRTDPLTGLHNRLALDADLDMLHRTSTRYGRRYSLALCDVDRFKAYNDTYGHPAGDQALRTVAAVLVEQLRDSDRVYRYGGEEFLVLLPEQDVAGADVAMERVRRELERAAVPHRTGSAGGVLTLSAGIADCVPGSRREISDMLRLADAALYRAKAGGRNAVACEPSAVPHGVTGDT